MTMVDRAEGLLDQIAEQSLDDDYYLVRSEPRTLTERLLTGIALTCFALMITVAAVQTRLDRPATEREQQALADDVRLRQSIHDQRTERLADLEGEVAKLTAAADRIDPSTETSAVRVGGVGVRGPGLVITLTPAADDGGPGAVSDTDLRRITNAVRYLGAEAVAVNGQRIGSLTSIRTAGSAVTVNYRSISPPYVIELIGDGPTIRERILGSRLGATWEDRAADTGLGFRIDIASDVRIGAIDDSRLRVTHATVPEVKK